MPAGITTTVGRVPIPFAGFGSYGAATGAKWTPARRRSFAGSSELVSIAMEALSRYRNAIDTADEACESQSGWYQAAFNYVTGNTSTVSICSAAEQMHVNYEYYRGYVSDPITSDDRIAEIIGFINKEVDIHDLVDLAAASNALTVTGRALLGAPGTAVGLVAEGAGEVLKGILGNIPWWGWALGAAYLATQLGWRPLQTFKR